MTIAAPTTEEKKFLARVARRRRRYADLERRSKIEYELLVDDWYEGYESGIAVTYLARASKLSDPAVHDALRKRRAKLEREAKKATKR